MRETGGFRLGKKCTFEGYNTLELSEGVSHTEGEVMFLIIQDAGYKTVGLNYRKPEYKEFFGTLRIVW